MAELRTISEIIDDMIDTIPDDNKSHFIHVRGLKQIKQSSLLLHGGQDQTLVWITLAEFVIDTIGTISYIEDVERWKLELLRLLINQKTIEDVIQLYKKEQYDFIKVYNQN